MANFEEENAQLRAELAAMKEDLAKAHDAMSAMMAAQEQPATSVPVTAEVIPSIPLSTVATDSLYPSQLTTLLILLLVSLVLLVKDRFLCPLLCLR
jgi:hypothetical protein